MSPCEKLISLAHAAWTGPVSPAEAAVCRDAIESGKVLVLPELPFACLPREAVLFTPAILGSSKNASFDPATGRLGGTKAAGDDARALRELMRRFSEAAASLVGSLLPSYRD